MTKQDYNKLSAKDVKLIAATCGINSKLKKDEIIDNLVAIFGSEDPRVRLNIKTENSISEISKRLCDESSKNSDNNRAECPDNNESTLRKERNPVKRTENSGKNQENLGTKTEQILSEEGKKTENQESNIDCLGILEVKAEGYGFLRSENLFPTNSDIYVAPPIIKKWQLRSGDRIEGKARPQPRDYNSQYALCYIDSINYEKPYCVRRTNFEKLVPIYPDRQIVLERNDAEVISTRIMDLISPIGKGQRGLIVSPPKAGKTVLLKNIANAITHNNPEVHLIMLLIDERPEEVTDIKESVDALVVSSTFDELPSRHIAVSELCLDHAQRFVEMGKDVVILMDSITRLARAYNMEITPTGRSLSGGLDPGALYKPKKFFGAARNIKDGGSLTIIATALVDTGSKLDDVIYEEFKGTGNMELHLDRQLADRRIFPAIDIVRSGTRKEELLLDRDALDVSYRIRKAFAGQAGNYWETADKFYKKFASVRSNREYIEMYKKKTE